MCAEMPAHDAHGLTSLTEASACKQCLPFLLTSKVRDRTQNPKLSRPIHYQPSCQGCFISLSDVALKGLRGRGTIVESWSSIYVFV